MADFKRSTHFRCWIFSAEAFQGLQRRQKALLARAIASGTASTRQVRSLDNLEPEGEEPESGALSWGDERSLVRHFSRMIVDVYAQGSEHDAALYSATTQATAIVLFRRFFLCNSPVAYSPWLMMLAAILLAGKVEERRVEPARLLKLFKYEDLTVAQLVLYESLLMEGCNFHFRIFHPYRPATAFVEDFGHWMRARRKADQAKGDGLGLAVLEDRNMLNLERSVRDACHNAVTQLLLSDALFLNTPSMLALGALAHAVSAHDSNALRGLFPEYLAEIDKRLSAERAALLQREVEQVEQACAEIVAAGREDETDEAKQSMRKLRKRLRKVCMWKDDVPATRTKKRKRPKEETED